MSESIVPTKQCTRCHIVFPATKEFFHQNKKGRYGLKAVCKACSKYLWIEWSTANRELWLAGKRAWRKRNVEKVKAQKAASTKRNRASANIRSKRYRDTHPEKGIVNVENRRARLANAKGSYTDADIQAIYDAQEGMCIYCGISIYRDVPRDVFIDHVIPLSKGGSNELDNIALCCQFCSASKGNHLLDEWVLARGW